MNKINKKIPMTLDRMLYLICYNWGICSEVEEIITKLVFWGDWRPSLLECPRLNFAKTATMVSPMFKIIWTDTDSEYNNGYPPSTAPHLDKITISKENLTRSDIIEIKKYYLARVFTTRFSVRVEGIFDGFEGVRGWDPCKGVGLNMTLVKKSYKKLSIKTFNGVVGRYCATNYW
jgi:hypothetical protein